MCTRCGRLICPPGLPNEQTFIANLEELLQARSTFRAMIIGIPRAVSMKEDISSDELSRLRQQIAQRVSASLPFTAAVAHLSGDFYAAIFPSDCTDAELEIELIEPLLTAFERPFKSGRRVHSLNVAIGVTLPVQNSSQSASQVMRDAWASYRVARKKNVRSNILSEQQLKDARDRAHVQREVRSALERD